MIIDRSQWLQIVEAGAYIGDQRLPGDRVQADHNVDAEKAFAFGQLCFVSDFLFWSGLSFKSIWWWHVMMLIGDGYNSFLDFIFCLLAATIEVNLEPHFTRNFLAERLEWTQPLMLQLVGGLIIYCAQGAFYLNKLLQFWPTEWVLWTKKETKNMKTAFARRPLSPDGQTVGMQMRFRELFSQKPASKWSADSLGQTAVLWFTNKEGCVSTRQCATTHCHTNHTTP